MIAMPKKFIETYKRSPFAQLVRSILRIVNIFFVMLFLFYVLAAIFGDEGTRADYREHLFALVLVWVLVGLISVLAWFFTKGAKEIVEEENGSPTEDSKGL